MVLTAVGALGVPALLLPFSWGTSPYQALVDGGLWEIALPAFLVAFIVPASVRWIVRGALSRVGESIGYTLAAGAVVLILLSYLQLRAWPDGLVQWIAVVGPILILLFGAVMVFRNRLPGRPRSYTPIMALQVAYLANGMLALASLFPDWEVGAYLVVGIMMAYSFQIDLVRKAPDQSQAP